MMAHEHTCLHQPVSLSTFKMETPLSEKSYRSILSPSKNPRSIPALVEQAKEWWGNNIVYGMLEVEIKAHIANVNDIYKGLEACLQEKFTL